MELTNRARGLISERDHERIFQQKVLPAMLSASERAFNPTAVILESIQNRGG